MVRFPKSDMKALVLLLLVLGGFLPASTPLPGASVVLGSVDDTTGLLNSQRGDNTDGENDAVVCGPGSDRRAGRRNRGSGDDDFADRYTYFVVTEGQVKSARRIRISATFYDDPAFAAEPVQVSLHYTNAASSGPGDLANTFALHRRTWTLSGSGGWVRHVWKVSDAGFRTFMQGTSDFRFDFGSHRVCIDQVEVIVDPDGEEPEEHLVGAHYYPWYDGGRWNYSECVAGALRLELDPPQRPVLGRYDSASSEVIDRHLRWCAEHGVNILILEFIRPESREDVICRQHIFPHPRSRDVRFLVLYDWAIRFASQFDVTPERIRTARADFDHLAREYFSRPQYLTVKEGRPPAMVYVTRALRGDVAGLIGALRDAASERGFDLFLIGDEFFFPSSPNGTKIGLWDGIFGYDVYAGRGGYWGTNGTLDFFRQRTDEYRSAAQSAGVKFFPCCAPGFNDRAIRRTCANNPAFPRRISPSAAPTSLFRETFVETALPHLDPEISLVAITSFNEWHEDTQIEPTAGNRPSTVSDSSPSGSTYTQGYRHDDYGTAFLELVRDATIAVTGTVRGPDGPLAGASVEVLAGETVLLARRSFSTGVYTVPRLRLQSETRYRLRASFSGLLHAAPVPFTVNEERTLLGLDLTLARETSPEFIRGDCNQTHKVDISDAIFDLDFLFAGGQRPSCHEACDVNGDTENDLSDAVSLLGFLFLGEPPPGPPFPGCGPDPDGDSSLGCEQSACR